MIIQLIAPNGHLPPHLLERALNDLATTLHRYTDARVTAIQIKDGDRILTIPNRGPDSHGFTVGRSERTAA